MNYKEVVDYGRAFLLGKHPTAHKVRVNSFANSVAQLVTGNFDGGPTIREHLVTYCAQGPGRRTVQAGTVQGVPVFGHIPDGTYPTLGAWPIDRALAFAEPIVMGSLADYLPVVREISQNEKHFDNDPADIAALQTLGL